jgi:hypothetical protein
MKIYIKTKIAALALTLLGTTACQNFLDVNSSPNSPTSVPPGLALSGAQLGLAFNLNNDLGRMAGAFVQHYAGAQNQIAAYDVYNVTASEMNNSWAFSSGLFAGTLKGFRDVQRIAEQRGNAQNYEGIAKVLLAYNFAMATDLFGDVPFSEALRYDEGIKNPRFDRQQDIYPALFRLIDEGLAQLQTPSALRPGTDDLYYGGNLAAWVRAANSLKLKLYLQIRRVDAAAARTGIAAVLAGGNYLRNNSEDLEMRYTTTQNNQNPLFVFAVQAREADICISQRFLDSLQTLNDPRVPFYFTNQGQARYIGFENGGTGTPPSIQTRARLGRYSIGFVGSATGGDAPFRMLTNFQTQFILAEAALTLGTAGEPRQYYEAGMRASLAKVGVAAADADTYVRARLATYDAARTNEARLNVIIRDKWAALVGSPIEAWNDYRRTGYPRLALASNAQNINSIPSILPYADLELSANPNAPAQQLLDRRVWWDVD